MTAAPKHYSWTRYWVALGKQPPVDHNGYSLPPESITSDAVSLREILATPCTVLLGEAGSGKSTSLHDAITLERNKTRQIFLDLRSYGDETRLYRDLFENDRLTSWLNTSDILTVYLDSLDECMVHMRTIASLLLDALQRLPVSRLHLRIACRTSVWPAHLLTTGLQDRWGSAQFSAFDLLPLTRAQVLDAATAEGFPAESLASALESLQLGPLAARPITLRLLFELYRKSGALPTDATDLYLRGCDALCTEINPSRLASGATGHLSTVERRNLAEWTAVGTLFGKKSTIYSDGNWPEPTDLPIDELAAILTQNSHRSTTEVRSDIQEVLSTSLFSDAGPHRRTWSHWSFAEFLAARYLANSPLSNAQLLDVLTFPDTAGTQQVVPQLRAVVGWLNSLRPDLLPTMLALDPFSLLHPGGDSLALDLRPLIVDALLDRASSTLRSELPRNVLTSRYHLLQHPGLYDQLRHVIATPTEDVRKRAIALEIAEGCHLFSLTPDILRIALDATDEFGLRSIALRIVAAIGSDAERRALRPLLALPSHEDPEDELKGGALKALWGHGLTAAELFQNITEPHDQSFFGAYQVFVLFDLPPTLTDQELPAAIDWAHGLDLDTGTRVFDRLWNRILDLCWQFIDDDKIRNLFLPLLLKLLKHHSLLTSTKDSTKASTIPLAENQRRILALHILPLLDPADTAPTSLVYSKPPLLLPSDFTWLLQQAQASPLAADRAMWVDLATRVFPFWQPTPEFVEVLWHFREALPELEKPFNDYFAGLSLGSAEARELRERHLESTRDATLSGEREEKVRSLVEYYLGKSEEGDLTAWWKLQTKLTELDGGRHGDSELVADLTHLECWNLMTPEQQQRCIQAARNYLLAADPCTSKWLNTNIIHRPSLAGLKAMYLLRLLQPDLLDFSDAVWTRWAPAILATPEMPTEHSDPLRRSIAQIAYGAAPDATASALTSILEYEDREHKHLFALRIVADCWDEQLALRLLDWVRSYAGLSSEGLAQLLPNLIRFGGSPALSYALTLLNSQTEGQTQEIAAIAAASLLKVGADNGWEPAWQRMLSSEAFGQRLITILATDRSTGFTPAVASTLPDAALGQLYTWASQHFTKPPTGPRGQAHFIGDPELVELFRDGLLSALLARGTSGSVAALRAIEAALPEFAAGQLTRRAEHIRLQRAWPGVTLGVLAELVRSKSSRVVETESQLMDVVLNSLAAFQQELRAELPSAAHLWLPNNRPRDENFLSDYVAHWLQNALKDKNIVLNREVQIRPGQETDIIVDAVSPGSGNIRVIVEVKGCWNPDLKTSMNLQLASRYMKNAKSTHGLYLVGWFRCPLWDPADYRLSQTPAWSLEDARDFFHNQAKVLSTDSIHLSAIVLDIRHHNS